MANVYIEHRSVGGVPLSWDIAHHLYARHRLEGIAIVYTEAPLSLLASVKKQWIRVAYKLRRELASTLVTSRKVELERTIASMEDLMFTTKLPSIDTQKGVFFMNDLLQIYSRCHTLYLTAQYPDKENAGLFISDQGAVIVYEDLLT